MRRRPISHREWRVVLAYALLLVALTTLPYIIAWSRQSEAWRFGGFLFGIEDGHSYLGKMRLGARGLWDFYLFYTPEAHDSAPLVFLPYILPGQVVGLFMDSTDPTLPSVMTVTFHLLRIAFDAVLVITLYRFIAAFLARPAPRFLALVLATLGGGLGWLLIFVGQTPPEFFIPEAFSWLILFGLPHLALARAALLSGLLALIASTERERWLRSTLIAAALWLVVGLSVPFYLVIVYIILGGWGLAVWIRTRVLPVRLAVRCIAAAGLTLPLFAYYAIIFSRNPALALWSAQNSLPSPPVLHYALAYLPLFVPALLGARWAWRRARLDRRYALLPGWTLVALPLVYLPINVQRRMAEAVIVPLAILAAGGLYARARRRRGSARRFRRAAVALGIIASLSAVLFMTASLFAASNPSLPLFRPSAELAAFAWLNQHAAPDDVVLAAGWGTSTGNALPAYTNQRPYMGHGPETLDWITKTEDVRRFFSGEMNADEREMLLETYAVRYVFYGPFERALSQREQAEPDWAAGMERIYDADGYQVYRVEQP